MTREAVPSRHGEAAGADGRTRALPIRQLLGPKPTGASLAVKDWSVLLPTVHIVAVCFFLIGYSYGFFHHIIEYIGVSDFLAASLRGVDQAYLLLFPPVLIFILRSIGLFDGDGQSGTGLAMSGTAVVLIIVLITLAKQFPKVSTQNWLEWLSILVMLGLFCVALLAAVKLDTHKFVGAFLSCLVLFCLTLGFGKGLRDRDRNYAEVTSNYGLCATRAVAVIRPLGSGFLALSEAEGWIVIDANCETKARLPVEVKTAPPSAVMPAITKP